MSAVLPELRPRILAPTWPGPPLPARHRPKRPLRSCSRLQTHAKPASTGSSVQSCGIAASEPQPEAPVMGVAGYHYSNANGGSSNVSIGLGRPRFHWLVSVCVCARFTEFRNDTTGNRHLPNVAPIREERKVARPCCRVSASETIEGRYGLDLVVPDQMHECVRTDRRSAYPQRTQHGSRLRTPHLP